MHLYAIIALLTLGAAGAWFIYEAGVDAAEGERLAAANHALRVARDDNAKALDVAMTEQGRAQDTATAARAAERRAQRERDQARAERDAARALRPQGDSDAYCPRDCQLRPADRMLGDAKPPA